MASTGFKIDLEGFGELLGFIDMHLEIKSKVKEVAFRVESKLDDKALRLIEIMEKK